MLIKFDEDPGLRIESFAIIKLRGVTTKLNIIFFHHANFQGINSIILLIAIRQLQTPPHSPCQLDKRCISPVGKDTSCRKTHLHSSCSSNSTKRYLAFGARGMVSVFIHRLSVFIHCCRFLFIGKNLEPSARGPHR